MKPQIIGLRCWLALFSLAASLQLTLGYYDPTAQRWINRDPIREPGFVIARKATSLHGGRAVSQHSQRPERRDYRFALNCPSQRIDSYGLQEVGEAESEEQESMADCWTNCMNTLLPLPLRILGCFSGLGALAAKVASAATAGEVLLILPVWASGVGVGCYLGCGGLPQWPVDVPPG